MTISRKRGKAGKMATAYGFRYINRECPGINGVHCEMTKAAARHYRKCIMHGCDCGPIAKIRLPLPAGKGKKT